MIYQTNQTDGSAPTISQVINALQRVLLEHGDLPVFCAIPEDEDGGYNIMSHIEVVEADILDSDLSVIGKVTQVLLGGDEL